MSENILIHSGPPAVYQLRPKKQEFGTLSRMTVGEKKPNKINKTILVVGETGAGKSILINALINYSMGVKFEDEVWFQIVDEEKKNQAKNQTGSQTSDVIVYEIFGYEDQTLPYSLTIIDTPGFGDTRGVEHDDIISHRLLDLFGSDDGVAEIHAVGLVMKAAENRLSDRLMYVFNSVMSLFGKNVDKQIVALITHSNGVTPENALEALEAAKIKCATNKKNEPVHFLFDNCQHKKRTEENEAALKHSWDITQTGMDHMMEFLGESGSQRLMTTLEVLKERIRLTACIQNLQERINLTELKQTEIRETEEAVKKHEEEMKKNQNFSVEVDEVYKEKEDIDGGNWGLSLFYEAAVCCTVCEENCHYPGCTMAWTSEQCWVMKGGRCTVCTKKCPASDHVKEKKKYVTKTRKVKKTIKEMKEKYEKSKEESENKSSILENLKEEMIKLTAEKKQFLDESYQHVISLEKIALNVDAVSTIVHLDFLIEKMKEEGDTEKVQKLEEMRSRVDERTRAAHWYSLAWIQSGIRNIEIPFPWKK
uniref:Septin-type G domain-containing protein n=1 Tax=Amphilophus citrinellus TaxID=61819 RepID=A0A3Q0T989_AMPCI